MGLTGKWRYTPVIAPSLLATMSALPPMRSAREYPTSAPAAARLCAAALPAARQRAAPSVAARRPIDCPL